MTDQELKALVAFSAWVSNNQLVGQSPSSIAGKYQLLMGSSDPNALLDLDSLNTYTSWLKQWRPDLAPKGGATPPEHLTGGNL